APGRPRHQEQRGPGGGGSGRCAPLLVALAIAELVVETPEVHEQLEPGADTGGIERGHVPLDQAHVHTGLLSPLAGPTQSPGDEVNTCDLPPSGRKLDRPDAAAAT